VLAFYKRLFDCEEVRRSPFISLKKHGPDSEIGYGEPSMTEFFFNEAFYQLTDFLILRE